MTDWVTKSAEGGAALLMQRDREIGERLRVARVAARVTREQLGAVLGGLTEQQVGNYERGESKLAGRSLMDIKQALGVSIYWLISGDEKPETGSVYQRPQRRRSEE